MLTNTNVPYAFVSAPLRTNERGPVGYKTSFSTDGPFSCLSRLFRARVFEVHPSRQSVISDPMMKKIAPVTNTIDML